MNYITINDTNIYNRNEEETRRIYKSIFEDEDYKFIASNDTPYIIDCGAHIGLATSYFKNLYLQSEIIAIEANPGNIPILKKNLQENNFTNIHVIWGALIKKEGRDIILYIDPSANMPWSWGDTTIKDIWGKDVARSEITVPALHLSEYLDRPVEFLKIDIEGAEWEVLEESKDKLGLVKQVMIEFHETAMTPHEDLENIRAILVQADFKIEEYPRDWLFIKGTRE